MQKQTESLTPVVDHDGALVISTGMGRWEKTWRRRETSWGRIVAKLKDPTRTPETVKEYHAMPKSQRADIKDVGGFVGGALKGGRRVKGAVAWRQLVTLDLDSGKPGEEPMEDLRMLYGCEALLYSTHSHTPEKPRWRLVLPLSRPVGADEYVAVSRRLAGDLGIEAFDDSTFAPERLMYWPSCPSDGQYVFERVEGEWLDPDAVLRRYDDWHDSAEWPRSERVAKLVRRDADKQGDPRAKDGLIGAFCRVYSVPDAIDKYLSDVYKEERGGRYTYIPGSSAGGLVLYDDGAFAYSNHGTDPASERLCNAFDLVRVHLFGARDEDAPEGDESASRDAMLELCQRDTAVTAEAVRHRFDQAEALNQRSADDGNWMALLDAERNGKIKQTINNARIVLTNDPALKDAYYYDEMLGGCQVTGDLPWQQLTDGRQRYWTDADDSGLRQYLQGTYGLVGTQQAADALNVAMLQRRVHPLRKYLSTLPAWDGVKRADTLLVDVLGAVDTPYTRTVTRKTLCGAVARALQPGVKFDTMLVLVGPQGCGKSSFCHWLGGEWFNDSLITIGDKDAFSLVRGSWIIEMGELAAARRSDIESLKMFISKTEDIFREAYARRTTVSPRQSIFIGTTNDSGFLRDSTGNRRFLPVTVGERGAHLDLMSEAYRRQVLAEARQLWQAGERLWLSQDEEAQANERRDGYREEDIRVGLVERMLDVALPPEDEWDGMDVRDRYAWLQEAQAGRRHGVRQRKTASSIEVWCEVFGYDAASFDRRRGYEMADLMRRLDVWERDASQRPNLPGYGRQRVWVRGGKR